MFDGPIRVDANTGWQPDEALSRSCPISSGSASNSSSSRSRLRRLDQLRWLQERSSLPIVADESCVFIEDLDGLVGVVDGVNVKLAKCGGIAPARRMLERAHELGFRTFLGCMEETQVGIAGLGGRRVARRLGGPGRLPAAGGRPVRRARRWDRTTAGGCRRRPGLGLSRRPI